MKRSIINVLKECLPPAVARFLSLVLVRKTFKGNFASWKAALDASTGYDSDRIVNKVKESARKVRDGNAAYERDSVLFDTVQYSWPVLAGILWVTSRSGNRLSLVDFGGALGSSYYQNRGFLDHLEFLRWSIVEQEKFVTIGKSEFENPQLHFYGDLGECYRQESPQILLLSSVLQYLEDPYRFLQKAISLGFEYIIVDRTLFFEEGPEEISVQVVPQDIYRASYPAWFLDRRKFLSFLLAAYDINAEFNSLAGSVRLGGRIANDKGFIFTRKRRQVDPGKHRTG